MKVKSMSVVCVVVLMMALMVPVISQAEEVKPVKNIIYFIGDGMAPSHVALTRYYSLFVLGKELNMTRVMNMGSTAYMTTYSRDFLVTDSAAAGTALATGYKTNNGMISMTPDGIPRITILEKAQRLGKSVGIASTTRITHATPASFAAHNVHRDNEDEIAAGILETAPEIILGGGARNWKPESVDGGRRKDGRNLFAEAEKMGYTVVNDAASFWEVDPATTDKLLGLFTGSHMSYEMDRDPAKEPSLAEITKMAIDILSKNGDGFFLMVEGGRIDHAAHPNDAAGVVWDTIAFDDAIGEALEYTEEDPNTLIVVTADHETGGLTITRGHDDNDPTKIDYMTINDLRLIGGFKASFEKISPEVQKAEDIAAIEAIVEKYTGIDITPEEAQMIKDNKPQTPVMNNLPDQLIGRAVADEISVQWSTGHHGGAPLMLFGVGPYSDRFTGFLDNTDVPKILSEAFQAGY